MSIKIENLNYIYMVGGPFEKQALYDINLEINNNEFIGLIGHTGSGKSTLIQHLNGLIKPVSGRILLDGVDINSKETSIKDVRRRVGLVFQYPEHQLFEETVYKDIAFGPTNLGLGRDEIHERVINSADYVGLDRSLLEKSPFEISGGQKRRAAIAGVLAMEPEVLILDEPTAGLDPAGAAEILEQIRALYHSKKMTVILVSHSMEEIARTVKRIIVMNHGRVFMDGKVNEVFMHGRELREIGLNVPQISMLIEKLIEAGYDIKQDTYTVQKAKNSILRILKEGADMNA